MLGKGRGGGKRKSCEIEADETEVSLDDVVLALLNDDGETSMKDYKVAVESLNLNMDQLNELELLPLQHTDTHSSDKIETLVEAIQHVMRDTSCADKLEADIA